MHFTSSTRLSDGITERRFTFDGIPGILWTPPGGPAPLILMGHPGGLQAMHPRLLARARASAELGFATAAIELPGGGDRAREPELDEARADLRQALQHGDPVEGIVERLVLPLVDKAVPEWQAVLDGLLRLPDVTGPVGYSGGPIAVGVRLAAVDERIAAAGLFAGSYVPASTFDEARAVRIPLHVLLQWDDEGNDRGMALDLFDAFASTEETLYASMGGHRGVPPQAGEDAGRFFVRHLLQPAG